MVKASLNLPICAAVAQSPVPSLAAVRQFVLYAVERKYSSHRPSLEHETQCAVTEARRIIQNLAAIETAFPVGFGLMAKEIRSWSNPPPSS